MNISLPPELEQYIHEKVSGGLYTSASEVVRESLRLMYSHEVLYREKRIDELNAALEVGMKQLENGQKIDGKVFRKKMELKMKQLAAKQLTKGK